MLLVDTNVWLAAADRRSRHHEACSTVLTEHVGELASVTLVIAETAWLLLDRAGPTAQAAFVAMITAGEATAAGSHTFSYDVAGNKTSRTTPGRQPRIWCGMSRRGSKHSRRARPRLGSCMTLMGTGWHVVTMV